MSNHDQTRKGFFIFILVCLAYLFVPFHRISPAITAVDIMRDMHLGAASMGVLASVFFFTYGAMQLPSGLLADSWGPRRTLPIFFAVAGVGAVIFGFADSIAGLILARALMGFGVAVVFICGIKLISRWFPPEAFARFSGIYLGMGGIGLILGSGPMAQLCTLVGWRAGVTISGVLGLVIAACMWIWVRDQPEDATLTRLRKTGGRDDSGHVGASELWASVKEICADRTFWLIAVWFFCQFSIHMSFGGLWGGPFLMDVHGMTRSQAGWLLNTMGLGMLAGGPLAGWLSESVFKARRPVMLLNAVGLILLFAVLAAYGASLPHWSMYLWFFCLAACGMGSLSVGFASVRDLFGDKATGTGGGLLNTLPSFGVSLFQPLTGWILESGGRTPAGGFTSEAYSLTSVFFIGVAFVGLLGALFAREPMLRPEASESFDDNLLEPEPVRSRQR